MKERFESDHGDRHVLRYRRLRVERQEVLFGDADPMLCRQGDELVLAGRGGSLARSGDGGVTWSQLADLATPAAPGGMVLALTADRKGTLLAAIQRSGAVLIVSADGRAGPWQVIAALDAELSESPRACLTALADGALLLCLPGRILRSTDDGAAWEPAAGLPAGGGTLHPLQLRSGRLVAAVGGAGGDVALGESEDGGVTWNAPEGFTPLSAPLAELPDGRLVLSYGMPHFPYGARAVVGSAPEDDAGAHWGDEVYVLALSRYAIREKARPVLAGAGVSAATAVTADGAIVSAFHRGAALGSYAPTIYGPGMDEWGRRPAVGVVRWTPEGLEKPPLVYPNLWSDRVDARGYLDNGMVRMRPDDRYEGGDYVENYEMTACRRVPAEHRYFGGAGGKGAVVCRHPDGSLVYSSRDCRIHRSTDEGARGASWPRSRCPVGTRRCSASG